MYDISLSIHIYIYIHMCVHIHIYIYMHTYTYIYIYISLGLPHDGPPRVAQEVELLPPANKTLSTKQTIHNQSNIT